MNTLVQQRSLLSNTVAATGALESEYYQPDTKTDVFFVLFFSQCYNIKRYWFLLIKRR